MTDRFRAARARDVLRLDAAIGTRLIARGLDPSGDDPSLWNRHHPDEVARLHERDVAAGSDAVLTNTFGANRAWLARFGEGDAVAALNRQAVAIARRAAGPDRFVLGSIGPTALEIPGALMEQAGALAEAGVEAIVLDTCVVELAERALGELAGRLRVPLLVSLFVWPEPLAEHARRLIDLGAEAIGSNCQRGMDEAVRLAERLREVTSLPLIVKPGAGLPGEQGFPPGSFAAAVPRLRALGPVLVGGCCGTTEAHLAALRAAWYPSR